MVIFFQGHNWAENIFFLKGHILKPSKQKSPSELNKAFQFWRGSKSQVFEHFFKGFK